MIKHKTRQGLRGTKNNSTKDETHTKEIKKIKACYSILKLDHNYIHTILDIVLSVFEH